MNLLERAQARGPVPSRTATVETVDDAYKAIDRLNYTFAAGEQQETLTGKPADHQGNHARSEELQAVGELSRTNNAIVDEEVVETVAGIPSEMEEMLNAIEDPTARDIALQNIKSMGMVAANEQATQQLMRGGLLKDSFAAPIYEEEERLKVEARQSQAQKSAAHIAKMLHMGYPQEEAEAQLKGLGVPMYAPEDIVVDVLMGVGTLPYRLLKAGLSSKQILKQTGKQVSESVYYGSLAGGFMTIADHVNSGVLTTALSGIIGPTLTGVLATGTRKGFATFLANTREKNPELFLNMMNQFKRHKDQKMSKVALEVLADIEAGRMSLTGEKLIEVSPFVRTQIGSEGEVNRASKIVASTLSPEDTKLKETSKTALGVTDETAHLTVQPYLGEVIEKELLIQNTTNLSTSMYNAITTGRIIGNHAFIDSGYENKVHDLVFNRYYQDGSFITNDVVNDLFRAGERAEVGKSVASHLGTATSKLKGAAGQLVEAPTHVYRQVEEFQRVAQKTVKEIKRKLLPKEEAELNRILQEGTSLDRNFRATKDGLIDPKTGQVLTKNPKVIDSWVASRKFLDQMHHQYNRAMNRDLKATGHKMLDDSMIVSKVSGKNVPKGTKLADGRELTKDLLQDGDLYMVKSIDGSAGEKLVVIPRNQLPHRIKEIDENLQTLGYRNNYTPYILDKDINRFFLTAVNKKTGASKTIAAGKSKKEAADLANRLSEADSNVVYVAHQRGLKADMGGEDIGINGNLLNFLRNQRGQDIDRLEAMLKRTGEFDQHTVDFMIKLAKKYNFGGDQFKKRGATRVKSIESVKKQLDELDPNDAELVKTALKQAEDAPLKPSLDAIAEYADKLSFRINTLEYNKRLERSFVQNYSDVLDGGQWNSRILASSDGLTDSQLTKAVEARVRQDQLRTIFNVPSAKVQQNRDLLASKLRDLEDKDSQVYKYLGTAFYKSIYGSGEDLSLTARRIGSAAAFLFNGSQFVVQQTGMLFALGKHLLTDPSVSATAMLDTNDVIMRGMLSRSLGLKLDPEVELKLRLLDRSGFIAGQGADFLDELRDVGKYRTLLGQSVQVGKDVGYIPLRTGEAIQRTVSWFSEYRAVERAIRNGTHPRLRMRDLNTDKMIAEVNITAERIAGNFTKINRGSLTKEGLSAAVMQFFQFPQIASEIMFGKSAQLTRMQRTGVWAAWAGAFGLEGVPMLWDVVDRVETVTDSQGYLKKEFRDSITEAISTFSDGAGLSPEFQDFLTTTALRGGISALTDDEVALANRATLASMTPRFFETMDIMDLMGPGYNAFIGIIGGSIRTFEDLKTAYDHGQLDDPEVIARSVKLNLNKISSLRNLATAVGEDGSLVDRYGDKVIDQMTTWQRLQIAIGIMPWEFVERGQTRWETRERERQDRDRAKEAVEKLMRVPAGPYRQTLFQQYAQAIAEEGDPVLLREFMSRGANAMIGSELSAEYNDLMLMQQRMKRGSE